MSSDDSSDIAAPPAETQSPAPVMLFAICASGTGGSFLVPDPFTDMSGLFVCPGTQLMAVTQEQANNANPSDIIVLDAMAGIPPNWLIYHPEMVIPVYPTCLPFTLDDVYPQEQEEEAVVSHPYREFPRTVCMAFDMWGEKQNSSDTSICEPCKNLQNVSYDDDGELANVFCSSCCAIIARKSGNKCDRGTPDCREWCWVNGLGEVSTACSGCHQYERTWRENSHQRGKRRRRRAKQAAAQAAAQKKVIPLPPAAVPTIEPTKIVSVSAGVWEITKA
jgi:hypothetical protein